MLYIFPSLEYVIVTPSVSVVTVIPCALPSYTPSYFFVVICISPFSTVAMYVILFSSYLSIFSLVTVILAFPLTSPAFIVTVFPFIVAVAMFSFEDFTLNFPPLSFFITSNVFVS